ncbi:accessory Sec system translocase SecA2 [Promicromonospora vindobonensis]|uniref:Protein translocase subunit SecA n=1 Tax=Promicromonospora vindobonensis TaxID=195748 RepID=A0ABW5VYG6_9MICO
MTMRLRDRSLDAFLRFLTRSERAEAERVVSLVAAARTHASRFAALSDAEIGAEAAGFRRSSGPACPVMRDDEIPRWCALNVEAAQRSLGLRPFDVQLLAAVRMLRGDVIEMATGEGKTLSGALAAAGYVLAGRTVHVLSVNDYLARRDAEWMEPMYRLLGVSVAWVGTGSSPGARRSAYAADVTYAAVSEVGFDVLRDRQCTRGADLVSPRRDVALVDEADSVMVDEARVPLVLAGSGSWTPESDTTLQAARVVDALESGRHFEIDGESRSTWLTSLGETFVETQLGGVDLYGADDRTATAINLALHARALLHRDVHYVVRDERVQLVDPGRGRIATLQRWPDGLQETVEAKEGISASEHTEIMDSITVQGLLNRYRNLCGMTGTARSAAEQLRTFYNGWVSIVPPNVPSRREDEPDRVYATLKTKNDAIVAEIERAHATARPVLVGTLDVAESEELAECLADRGIDCAVLNAKNDADEAGFIARAGELGAVTISTQIAGRGTDIRLGGPDGRDREVVAALGGLYVIGTGHHPSSRLDDQLRGRAGRQGDPGSSVFFTSLEDKQMVGFGDPASIDVEPDMDGRLQGMGVIRAIEHAQRVAEGANLAIHANTWRYSRVIEHQRGLVDEIREQVLHQTEASAVLAQRCPERFQELRESVPAKVLDDAARVIMLYHLDRRWAEHLAFLADLRESIHLNVLAGKDPLAEFNRTAGPAFQAYLDDVYDRSASTFTGSAITADGLDMDAADMNRPTSTWTYMVHDNPFGSALDRIIRGLHTAHKRRVTAWRDALSRINATLRHRRS